jgi:hypothetical protein
MHAAVVDACGKADVRTKLEGLGGEVVCNTPSVFGAMLAADVMRWKRVAEAAKIKVD